jgi:hypothetical protein
VFKKKIYFYWAQRTINRDKEILNYNMQNNNFILNNDSSSWTPAIVYNNADTEKLRILTENKGKAGIYQWTHNQSLGPSPKNVYRFCL